MQTRGALPVNLKVVIEGEEESSSIHLDAWLEANKDRLTADFAVISDTGFFEGNLPAITVGLRGIVYIQLDVTGSNIDLHSGGYGGAVDNPINALCQIVAALKGPDGRVLVPGFYDDVVELTARDRAALARLPFDEEEYRESIGVPACTASPATPRSSASAPGRRSTSAASGAASRARAPRRSFRPTPTPRSAAAWSPTRIPEKIFGLARRPHRRRWRRSRSAIRSSAWATASPA